MALTESPSTKQATHSNETLCETGLALPWGSSTMSIGTDERAWKHDWVGMPSQWVCTGWVCLAEGIHCKTWPLGELECVEQEEVQHTYGVDMPWSVFWRSIAPSVNWR